MKLVKKFSKSEKDIVLIFDNRIASAGVYEYNCKKKRHEIRVSSKDLEFDDPQAKVYELISTILHELKHLQQQENLGANTFESEKFAMNKCIKNPEAAAYFSDREIEARIFEEKNVLSAVEFYCKNSTTVLE